MNLPWVAAGLAVAGLATSAALSAPRLVDPGVALPRVTGAPYVVVPEYGLKGAGIVGYAHGAAVAVEVPVRNEGRLSMTVTSVELVGGGPAPLLALAQEPGLSVSVPAGQTRTLTLRGVLGNCRYFHEREMTTHDHVALGVRVLGRETQRQVLLDRPLMVRSPMIVGCPDRKLNRQADNRSDLL